MGRGICGGAAAAECGQFGGSGGLCGASIGGNGRDGGVLVREALVKGLRHLAPGQAAHRKRSRLEPRNRELRRREKLGTVWTEHNLLALLQKQGLLNQTT